MPGGSDGGAQVPGTVGRISVPDELSAAGIVVTRSTRHGAGAAVASSTFSCGLSRDELRGDRRVRVLRPETQSSFSSVMIPVSTSAVTWARYPPGLGRLARYAEARIHGGDDAVFGDLAGDPPPPVGSLSWLHALHGDQRVTGSAAADSSSSWPFNAAISAFASLTSADTKAPFTAGSSQPIFDLPGSE